MHSPLRFLPSVFGRRGPIHFTLFLTRRCNARCPFCFYLEGKPTASVDGEITLDEVRRFSPSLGDLLWLAFSGGEIFLREDLLEITRVFYSNNRPSIMLYPTNGLMPGHIRETTEAVLKSCPKSVVVIKLSLDGIGERQDALRGVSGSFKKVLETYEALRPLLGKYSNFELGVNTVFCRENQDRMGEIISFVKGLAGIKTHTISLVRGDNVDGTFKDIDAGKYMEAIEALEKGLRDGSAARYGFRGARVKAAQDILQRRLIHRTITGGGRVLPCRAGRLNIVMTEDGELYPCESFREAHRLGNIRTSGYDIRRLLKDGKNARVISDIRKSCFCTHECYMMTNILFNPLTYPSLLRETLRL
jgi:radical SAM protein with 4Fe4S-binding SPASM domain